MTLSIILVNYKVKLYLEQCLLSVRQAIVGIDAEVIVVDNASQDDSIAYLQPKFPEVLFIQNKENTGFSCANNLAIKQSKGEYVLLLNPDTVLGEQVLHHVLQFMKTNPDAGAVGVKMIDRKGKFLPESKRGLPTPWNSFCKMFGLASMFPKLKSFGKYRLLYLDKNLIHEVAVLSGAFMFIRSKVLAEVGLLDETFFMYGEDIDLSYRILQGGYKNYYLPETIIHYKGESTKKGSIIYLKIFYGAMLIFYRKHYPKQSLVFSFLVQLAVLLHSVFAFIKNKLGQSFVSQSIDNEMLIPHQGQSYEVMISEVECRN